jgi:hypothetical protein
MERIAQYLDDLEDLIYAIALKWERIRSKLRFSVLVAAGIVLQALGILIALSDPPLAMAVAALLAVYLLNHGIVFRAPGDITTA